MATLPVGSLGCWLSFRWAIYFYHPRRIFEPHVDLDIDLPNIAMLTLARSSLDQQDSGLTPRPIVAELHEDNVPDYNVINVMA